MDNQLQKIIYGACDGQMGYGSPTDVRNFIIGELDLLGTTENDTEPDLTSEPGCASIVKL